MTLWGCSGERNDEVYHSFPDKTWHRFNLLQFEIPVEAGTKPVNVVFFARHDKSYPYDSLAFNMIMKTPSGEERVREFRLKVKDPEGNFLGTFQGDSCEIKLFLRKEMVVGQDGMLFIELENLVPRMRTTGLYGVGIRLEKI